MPSLPDCAAWYISKGYVAVRLRGKAPIGKGWPDARPWPAAFSGCSGVGLHLGPSGLADVDLDCPEARDIASEILPETPAKFGRGGQITHWLYRCPDAEMARLSDGRDCMVELRAGPGKQTMVPPSVHPSGEAITWHGRPFPSTVPAVVLERSVHVIGAAVLLMRAGMDWRAVVEAGPSKRISDPKVRLWLGWDIPKPPAPKVIRNEGAATSFGDAARAYCQENHRTFPSRRGKCPICSSPGGFGGQRGVAGRWTCFSARHSQGGVEGRDFWSGDVVDMDAALAGMSPAAWLRETGYLG